MISQRAEQKGVSVTGVGLVTPLGLSSSDSWDRSVEGRTGIGPLTRFDVSGHACRSGAAVADFDLSDSLRFQKNVKFMSRSVMFGVRAAQESVANSGIDLGSIDPYRKAVYIGSGQTGLESSEFMTALSLAWAGDPGQDFKHLGGRPSRLIDAYFSLRTLSNAGIAFLSIEFDAQGPSSNFVQSDTASTLALSSAYYDLLEDRCDVAFVGGYESLLNISSYLAYESAGLLSEAPPEEAYRPFDPRSDGLVLGEGAGFLVLERTADARRRGAPALGEILAVSTAMDTSDTDEPRRSDAAARKALRGLAEPEQIDFVVAHGIGTRAADRQEGATLSALFGDRIPVTAFKGHTGYLGAATGTVELALAFASASRGKIPPIARQPLPQLETPLDLVTSAARPCRRRDPLALCLGWSWTGQSTALLIQGSPASLAGPGLDVAGHG